jgi:hypothetical protein
MALFGNKQEANLRSCIKMVENVIIALGLNPEENKIKTSGDRMAYGLMKGSAEVYVSLKQEEDGNYIRVFAPVMTLPQEPANQISLYRHLLTLNAGTLVGAAFGLNGDHVVLVAERNTLDLDQSEVEDMINRVGHYADYYDDALVNQFGGQRYSDVSRF